MAEPLELWWTTLRGLAALNVALWLWAARRFWREQRALPAHERAWRGAMLLLSAGYVAGCAWRSLLPVFDVPRLVLVDSFWSSVLVGRSVATAAELCFAAQWALLLRETSRSSPDAAAWWTARALVPLIVLAELFSWYSVLSTSNVGHMVEETLWCVGAVAVAVALWRSRPADRTPARRWAQAAALAAALYALYLLTLDVPTYAQRWLAQAASGHTPLGVIEGLADAASRWTVAHDWQRWRGEVVWMTAYFSLGVWCSIALVRWPAARPVGAGRSAQAPERQVPDHRLFAK